MSSIRARAATSSVAMEPSRLSSRRMTPSPLSARSRRSSARSCWKSTSDSSEYMRFTSKAHSRSPSRQQRDNPRYLSSTCSPLPYNNTPCIITSQPPHPRPSPPNPHQPSPPVVSSPLSCTNNNSLPPNPPSRPSQTNYGQSLKSPSKTKTSPPSSTPKPTPINKT
jgi:hypothetical protein